MPQISRNDIPGFLNYLRSNKVSVRSMMLSVNLLRPTQREVNHLKVSEKVKAINTGTTVIKPFIVSSDNYILDGHHQLEALKAVDPDTERVCFKVGIPMVKLLKLAHGFEKTFYKDIQDETI